MGVKGNRSGILLLGVQTEPLRGDGPKVPAMWKNLRRENSFMSNSYCQKPLGLTQKLSRHSPSGATICRSL